MWIGKVQEIQERGSQSLLLPSLADTEKKLYKSLHVVVNFKVSDILNGFLLVNMFREGMYPHWKESKNTDKFRGIILHTVSEESQEGCVYALTFDLGSTLDVAG